MENQTFSADITTAPDDEIVCWCSRVSKRTILEATRNGDRTIDDVRSMTGACTVGRCKELSPRGRCCSREIKQLLESEIKQPEGP
jgi:NAD(P)H-nitrite reductase large subunit